MPRGAGGGCTLAGMDDMDDDLDLIRHWDELDAFARGLVRCSQGRLWPTLAISFVGTRPDLLVQAPVFVVEEADDIVSTLVDFFGALRPDRLAVLWPSRYELDDGTVYWALRVNSAERAGPDRWTWRTRLHAYTVDDATREVELYDAVDLADPPDPQTRRLRTLYSAMTRRRIERRGWFAVPDKDGWDLMAHPASTTLRAFDRVDSI